MRLFKFERRVAPKYSCYGNFVEQMWRPPGSRRDRRRRPGLK
jgi:hypothetical protein